jgi:NADH-quinone oxidoreductase subunit G
VATLYVDGRPYDFEDEHRSLLDVCLSLGFDVPYFCWHPAMHSVGACRQCAVKQFKDEKDTRGKIVMSCMTPAADGTRISIDDPEVRAFRASVIEWLMRNHPHDCPVCDEGGECHLQDMTVMTGHVYRRNRFPKRTHRNQDLGPFIYHEMNRCIQCYRCIRFYRDYAGGRDLEVFGWHDHVYFGRYQDGPLESEFSGNLVEVCPTGVFTDKTFRRHYTRKWDLQTAPSICVHCGVGCNTIPAERYGTLRRIRARYHHEVNGYFLCDRGRFGYEFVNHELRIRRPLLRQDGEQREVSVEEALERAAHALKAKRLVGIGSPRASLESNFALQRLVGKENFFHGIAAGELELFRLVLRILGDGPTPVASLREVGEANAVLLLGEDVSNTAPMLTLALRQAAIQKPLEEARGGPGGIPVWEDAAVREAIQQERGPFFVATPDQTKLDEIATAAYRGAPRDLARLGLAVAHELDGEAPEVTDLPGGARELAGRIARALAESTRPLVVCGTSCGSRSLIEAAANVAWALSRRRPEARLAFTVPECNSMVVALLEGGSLDEAAQAVIARGGATIVILENDICRRLDASLLMRMAESAGQMVGLDHLRNSTTGRCSVVLPAATFAESSGTLVSSEGRAQRFVAVMTPEGYPEGEIRDSWRWLGELLAVSGREPRNPWPRLQNILADMARRQPQLSQVPFVGPPAEFRLVGGKIPRQPQRYSGRTAMAAHLDIHEQPPPEDPDSPLAFSMEGYAGQPPPALVARYWSPGWNSVQAVNKYQVEVAGRLRGGDPGVRLLSPRQGAEWSYFTEVPGPFRPRERELWVLPCYHVFGSEELSRLSPGIAARTPAAQLSVSPADAGRLGLQEGEAVEVLIAEVAHRMRLHLSPALAEGTATVPMGHTEVGCLLLPAWGRVARARPEGEGS